MQVSPAEPEQIQRGPLVVTAAVTAGMWLVLSEAWPLRPLRWLVTLVHEAGHASVARLLGNDVLSVTINPSGGGLTFWAGGMGTMSRVLVGSAGYMGAAAVGGLLLAGCRHLRSGRLAVGAMAGLIAAIAVFWVPWRINPTGAARLSTGSGSGDGRFTWLFCVLAAAALAGLATQRSTWLRRYVVIVVATTLCLAGVEDARNVLTSARHGGHSDATIVAGVTPLPAWFWAGLWLLAGVAACVGGLWWMVRPAASDDRAVA